MQDAAKEQLRRKIRRKETAGFFERGGRAGWRYTFWESYDAAQGWIVVTIIGEYTHRLKFWEWKTDGDRCDDWNECGIFEYHHRVALRCEAGALQNGVLSE